MKQRNLIISGVLIAALSCLGAPAALGAGQAKEAGPARAKKATKANKAGRAAKAPRASKAHQAAPSGPGAETPDMAVQARVHTGGLRLELSDHLLTPVPDRPPAVAVQAPDPVKAQVPVQAEAPSPSSSPIQPWAPAQAVVQAPAPEPSQDPAKAQVPVQVQPPSPSHTPIRPWVPAQSFAPLPAPAPGPAPVPSRALPYVPAYVPRIEKTAENPYLPRPVPVQSAPAVPATVVSAPQAFGGFAPMPLAGPSLGSTFSGLLYGIPLLPESGRNILPTIKKVYPTGEKPLVVVSFKCPTELVGVAPPTIQLLHELVSLGMDGINRTDLLSFNLQQVCQ